MDWLASRLRSFEVLSQFAHGHGNSQLWRLSASGQFQWLKMHRQPGKWAGEIFALKNWSVPTAQSPAVLATREDPPTLLMSEVPGVMATEISLNDEAERTLWKAAGRYLAELHQRQNSWFGASHPDGSPQGTPHADAASFVRQNVETRIKQGTERGMWSPEEREFIIRAANEWIPSLEGETPVAVHRDFGPRNWLTDETGKLLSVIDWEHARWDVRAADLNRPWDDAFLTKPHLAEPFEEGYGGFSEKLREQIKALRFLGATAGVVWATEVQDLPYAELNRAALRRLASGQ